MGKKSIKQASEKAPKNHEKQLHSLIKVLKPKVYITDSSNFKQLVQQLTGCGGGGQTEVLTQPMPMHMPQLSENIPVIDISSDVSGGSDIDFEVYDQLINQEVNCPVQMDNQSTTLDLTYRNLESWLLDLETCNWYEVFSQSQEEIGVFDYNVAGLL